jgi:hypothetical protein
VSNSECSEGGQVQWRAAKLFEQTPTCRRDYESKTVAGVPSNGRLGPGSGAAELERGLELQLEPLHLRHGNYLDRYVTLSN